ncbi:hypothetical protein BGW38_004184 [Lunasporangiospora selenospora]|uniref:HbrB-like-domain-containing protein n=1 Tax=Lunasporangiospora selenospora TaxID=979761 RepID=A0A9P6KCB8_9FUNG|nr:hypothetical protein BGW38_004184 [Lunasporangiospora selenospora]
MNPSSKPLTLSTSHSSVVSASVDSLNSIPGIRDPSSLPTNAELLLSTPHVSSSPPHSLNSTSASSLSSSGSLPIHQQHSLGDVGSLLHRINAESTHGSLGHARSQSQNHTRSYSTNSQRSLRMNSRTPSESHVQMPSHLFSPTVHGSNSSAGASAGTGTGTTAPGGVGMGGTVNGSGHYHPFPGLNTNPALMASESHGSTYLSSPNDTHDGHQSGMDSPTSVGASTWTSPPMDPHQGQRQHPVVSTSVSSGCGLTSPVSLPSPIQLPPPQQQQQSSMQQLRNQPTQQQQQQQQLQLQQQQSQQPQQQVQPQQPPVVTKPKKEKHTFGGMSASSFLTETLPATGMRLYQGSRKGAKSHGEIPHSSNASISSGKSKKSSRGVLVGTSTISSIGNRKQQLSPGGGNSAGGSLHNGSSDKIFSTSASNMSSPMTPDHKIHHLNSTVAAAASVPHHHYLTSPTMPRNNYSSLDAKVMYREMSGGHSTEDVWQDLCIKVLTLFNGQGLTGAIEDLNDLVRRCLATRSPSALCDEVGELLENGMLTLNAKLTDVPDEKLVSRLVELWSFFFGTVLPYFEGVFLPLQVELRSGNARRVSRKLTGRSGGGSSGGGGVSSILTTISNGGSGLGGAFAIGGNVGAGSGSGGGGGGGGGASGLESAMSIASPRTTLDLDRNNDDVEPENIRTMALTAFRDSVILPKTDRLRGVFANLFVAIDASIPVTDTASRMLQMTSILTSIQSGDHDQTRMEEISNRLKANWKQFTRRGNRGGFVGLDKKITAPSASASSSSSSAAIPAVVSGPMASVVQAH